MTIEKINGNKFEPINSIKLFGLDNYLQDFVKLYKKDKLPKVIMLTGNKGIGKFTLAFHFINYVLSLNTENKYLLRSCEINKNNIFYKSILQNTCENFFYIQNTNKKKTSIEDIRNIKKKFNTTSINNLHKFTVIDDVEMLNINAANALLKLIEEPSKSDYFILINNKKKQVIETIKSRSIETKIFLSVDSQNTILNNLLNTHQIENHYSQNFIKFSSPGNILNFSLLLNDLKITENKSLYDSTAIILDNYKKSKDEIFLNCLDFLIEIKFNNVSKFENKDFLKFLNTKSSLIKLLYDFKNFNLNSTSVLDYIRRHVYYA